MIYFVQFWDVTSIMPVARNLPHGNFMDWRITLRTLAMALTHAFDETEPEVSTILLVD